MFWCDHPLLWVPKGLAWLCVHSTKRLSHPPTSQRWCHTLDMLYRIPKALALCPSPTTQLWCHTLDMLYRIPKAPQLYRRNPAPMCKDFQLYTVWLVWRRCCKVPTSLEGNFVSFSRPSSHPSCCLSPPRCLPPC